MNVVSNNCIGGYLYKLTNQQYSNPFMWSIIAGDNMNELCENYDKMDFNNFEFTSHEINERHLNIDGVIVNFTHYKYDPLCLTPTKDKNDVFYCRSREYIVEKYKSRLARIKNEPPIFVADDNSDTYFNINRKKRFLQMDTPYVRILLTTDKEFEKYNDPSKNIFVIIKTTGNTEQLAKQLIEKFPQLFSDKKDSKVK